MRGPLLSATGRLRWHDATSERRITPMRGDTGFYILGDVEGVRSPDDEVWGFEPGTRIEIAEKRFYDGEIGLVAIARA